VDLSPESQLGQQDILPNATVKLVELQLRILDFGFKSLFTCRLTDVFIQFPEQVGVGQQY
jgi:hypothetical protein